VEKLSRERPLGNIFNFYVLLSVLLQFALHIGSMVYITELAHGLEEYVIIATPLRYACLLTIFISRGPIDLEAKFEANLLNTAVFLLGLSQQVSTFAINFQVSPALFILGS
jgi:cation-transporting ATPase 13A1